jgi:MFS family permease
MPASNLWRQGDFLRLWTAQTVSLFGSQVTILALPTVAILLLRARPVEVGVLAAIPWLAYLGVGVFVGVIVDRFTRRQIMIGADIGRALALGSVPLAFALGFQSITHLYVVAGIVGILNIFFDVAYQAYLPTLLGRDQLIEGNTRLAMGEAAALTGGPALSGLLIGAVGAALAVVSDAASYLVSALCITAITGHQEMTTQGEAVQLRQLFREIGEGIGLVMRHPIIRTLASVSAVQNFSESVAAPMLLIFMYNRLHLTPTLVGLTLTVGSAGFLLGASLVSTVTRRLGVGRMLWFSSLLGVSAYLLLPLGIWGIPLFWVGLWRLLLGLHLPTYNVNVVSVRQKLIPDRLQGRVNATLRTLIFGIQGGGPLVGGVLGALWGPAPTILCGGVLFLLGSLPLLSRAVITLKQHAAPSPEMTTPEHGSLAL